MEWLRIDEKTHDLPLGAVAGGYTDKGEVTYVARYVWVDDAACGAYIPSKKVVSVPYGSIERLRNTCDVLVCHDPEILFWTDAAYGQVPDLAVAVNIEEGHKELMYVARTRPNTALTGLRNLSHYEIKINEKFKGPMLGKLHPSHGTMYLAHDGSEYFVSDYQVLCAYTLPTIKRTTPFPYTWVSASDGYIPEGGLIGGRTENDEPTFVARICRSPEQELYEAGYVVPSKKMCFYTDIQKVFATNSYEVLVTSNPEQFSWSQEVDDVSHIVYVNEGESKYIARSKPGFKGLLRHTCKGGLKLNPSDKNFRLVCTGCVHYYSNFDYFYADHLHVRHNDNMLVFTEFETLVASLVPNTLRELCRYAVLQWTSGVPGRINRLPLPEKVKEFCQLREEEKEREQP